MTDDNISPLENKSLGGHVVECKEQERNGIKVGIVAGYIATWDLDRGDWCFKDQFAPGAFAESIQDLKNRKRQIRLKDHHGRTIGGFPIETVKEDAIGLFGIGEINLEVQQGREAFLLAKQGVLTDFSIGFTVINKTVDEELEIRTINKATVWEGSIVDEPMNPKAVITVVKSNQFLGLDIDSKTEWNPEEAIARVKEFTSSEDNPSPSYKNGFLLYDTEKMTEFDSYKFLMCDVVNGKLVVIPKALFALTDDIKSGNGMTSEERSSVIKHAERYYVKMGMESPFDEDDKQYFIENDVDNFTKRDLENALRKSGTFSKSAAKSIVSRIVLETWIDGESGLNDDEDEDKDKDKDKDSKSLEDLLSEIQGVKNVFDSEER